MVDQNVLDYVRTNLSRGFTEEQVKQGLLSSGNDPQVVEDALSTIKSESQQTSQNNPSPDNASQEQTQTNQNQNMGQQQYQQSQEVQQSPSGSYSTTGVEGNNNTQPFQGMQDQGENAQQDSQQQVSQTQDDNVQDSGQVASSGPKSIKRFFVDNKNALAILSVVFSALFVFALAMIMMPEEGLFEDPVDELEPEGDIDDPAEDFDTTPDIDDPVDEQPDNDSFEDDYEVPVGDGLPDPDDGHDDDGEDAALSCRLGVSNSNIEVALDDNMGLFAHGGQGEDVDIHWGVEDDDIIDVIPEYARYTAVMPQEIGDTRIIVTDNAVGEDCTYTIAVTVVEAEMS